MHTSHASTAPDLVAIKRALISVSDKTGIVQLATALQKEFGIELLSTGGTAKALRDAGLTVSDVSEVTGFPEMMDGRVKTLHPLVHGALLGLRDHPEHVAAMEKHAITPIDLVIINLYPFEATVAKPGCTFGEAIENVDIGGPSMIRSAAKNHRSVAVVTDPFQYDKLLKHLRQTQGQTPYLFRLDLAMWAFTRTAQYDAAIYPYLAEKYFAEKAAAEQFATNPPLPATVESVLLGAGSPATNEIENRKSKIENGAEYAAERAGLLPALTPRLRQIQPLRYGENPHQLAAFYTIHDSRSTIHESSIATARQLHGKALSYINILDADAAIELVREFAQPAAAVIKHTNPCGCAVAATLADAFDLAYAGDPVAAFGGIVALNQPVDMATAERIVSGKRFLEVLVAPEYAHEALTLLQGRWKDCRILATGPLNTPRNAGSLHYHSVTGGMLVQQVDLAGFERSRCTVTSQKKPSDGQWSDLMFTWLVTKHVKSNAVCLVKNGQLLGAGAGQMSRPMSAKIAIELARQNGHAEKLAGSAAGSDAFFPFPDGPLLLLDAGATAIIHPGGSKKDQDTIDLVNQRGGVLVATGERHFKH